MKDTIVKQVETYKDQYSKMAPYKVKGSLCLITPAMK